MIIFCCQCNNDINARLTNGKEIYPHREEFFNLPFWICDTCKNYVGCHHKTKDKTKPLGVIPNPEIRIYRRKIHDIINKYSKGFIYSQLSKELGYEYHTANLKTVDEAKRILEILDNKNLGL